MVDDLSYWNGEVVHLSKVFGVEIVRFIQWTSNDGEPSYGLEIKDCEHVDFPNTENLSQAKFRNRVLGVTHKVISKCPGPEWEVRQQLLFKVIEVREGGTSRETTAMELFDEYCIAKGQSHDDMEKALPARKYWIADDKHWWYMASFRTWCNTIHGESFTVKEMGRFFKARGANKTRFNEERGGRRTTVCIWNLSL